jgi:hypothetical protein
VVCVNLECSLRKFETGLIERPEGVLQIWSGYRICCNSEQLVHGLWRLLDRSNDAPRGCNGEPTGSQERTDQPQAGHMAFVVLRLGC